MVQFIQRQVLLVSLLRYTKNGGYAFDTGVMLLFSFTNLPDLVP